ELVAHRGERGIEAAYQRPGCASWDREHHVVGVERLGVGLDDPPAACVPLRETIHLLHRARRGDLGVAKLVRDVEHEIPDAWLERPDRRAGPLARAALSATLPLQGAHGDDKRAVIAFGFDELRNTRANGERVRIAREDAAEERTGDPVGHVAPEPARDER